MQSANSRCWTLSPLMIATRCRREKTGCSRDQGDSRGLEELVYAAGERGYDVANVVVYRVQIELRGETYAPSLGQCWEVGHVSGVNEHL